MTDSISGFKFYETKPAKTFGSNKEDEQLDICEWCTLPAEVCYCSDPVCVEAHRKFVCEGGRLVRKATGFEPDGVNSVGYKTVRILGNMYQAHRVIWLMHYGEWPSGHIDHINGVRSDNRIENLRDVSMSENRRNSKKQSNNTSGIQGVNWCKRSSKWVAKITVHRKCKHLGYYDFIILAAIARKKAEIKYNFHKNHGRAV